MGALKTQIWPWIRELKVSTLFCFCSMLHIHFQNMRNHIKTHTTLQHIQHSMSRHSASHVITLHHISCKSTSISFCLSHYHDFWYFHYSNYLQVAETMNWDYYESVQRFHRILDAQVTTNTCYLFTYYIIKAWLNVVNQYQKWELDCTQSSFIKFAT